MNPSRNYCLPVLIVALALTALIYWPGLAGSFTFDDTGFVTGNSAIQVSSLHLADWVNAAMSFPANHQGRWLTMLSFAANHYFTGMNPYWYKLTNLVIHLLNGVLLYLALRALFHFHQKSRSDSNPSFNGGLAAATLAALWLVLPINLTGVLYVSQRLESLSNTFVFLGLAWYLRARLALWQEQGKGTGLWLALITCTGIGVLVKESAVLLPLYAFSAELALTGFRARDGRWSRPVLALYGTLLLIPLMTGLVWLAGWVGGPNSYGRAFDIPQRLMTEGRVLMHYMAWTLVPSLDSLTLYHDDIQVSRSLLDPPATLASVTAIAGLIAFALWKRSQYPLLALGIFWYFGGHLLTATIIPLMLAFEHRNYFPSAGLLLAMASLLALEFRILRQRRWIAVASFSLFAFYAFTTALRAREWSSPLALAASDAAKRPDSSAAQYEYARVLLGSTLNGDPEPMRRKAFAVLENMAANPDADAVHNQLLIVTSAKLGLPINDMWWESMIAKLKAHPVTSIDVSALTALLTCVERKVCPRDIDHLRRAYEAASSHPGGYAQLLSGYAKFALVYLGDLDLAGKLYRDAIDRSPSHSVPRANLVMFLIRTGEFEQAEIALEDLRKLNYLNRLDAEIADLQRSLDVARSGGMEPVLPAQTETN